MKFKDINNEKKLNDLGDIWFLRAKKLYNIVNDSSVEKKKRTKAFLLFIEMHWRLTKITAFYYMNFYNKDKC